MKLKKPKLETERLILRPLKQSDAEDFVKIKKKSHAIGLVNTIKKAKTWIRNANLVKHGFFLGVVLKENKKVIGILELCHLDWFDNKAGEICYHFNKAYWGKGYATESAKELINFCFKKLKFRKVYADTDHDNYASQKVLKKLGFKLEGRIREKHLVNGKWKDELDYGLLRREWKK